MYRNCHWDQRNKCIKLATWDEDGKRVRIDLSFKPYLYVDSPKGKYISIFEQKVDKREFNTPYDRTQFIKRFGSNRFYENFDVNQQFLLDCYWKHISDKDFAANPLRILMLDIEVDPLPGGEFPNPKDSKAEINIITVYDTLDETYYVFSKYDYSGDNLIKGAKFLKCNNEKHLLERFLRFWQSNDYPDIVTGWNLNGFDMPYIANRIAKVLGEEAYFSLSPYNNIRIREGAMNKINQIVDKYDISGVSVLDFIDVYAKYKVEKQESYKLDFIAELELGYGKVDYDGMTIFEFMEKDWNKFVEYNVQDVKLLVDLEDKLRYFKILRGICNMACANYEKCLFTVPITNGAIAVRARQRNRVLHTFIREPDPNIEKKGGYVSSNAGLYHDIVSVDATSLYPNQIITNNISPETEIGICLFKQADTFYELDDEHDITLRLTNGLEKKLKKKDVVDTVKKHNLIVTSTGSIFSQSKEGILPQFMREVFTDRDAAKTKMKQLKKDNVKLKAEIKKLKAML